MQVDDRANPRDPGPSAENDQTPYYPFGVLGKGYIVPKKRDRDTIVGIYFCHMVVAVALFQFHDMPDRPLLFMIVGMPLLAASAVAMTRYFLWKKAVKTVPASIAGTWRSQVAHSKASPRQCWFMMCAAFVLSGVLLWAAVVEQKPVSTLVFAALMLYVIVDLIPYIAYGRGQLRGPQEPSPRNAQELEGPDSD